jgi:Rhodopirellula transposase DDE domain
VTRLEAMVEDATAGDPMCDLRWTHKSTRKLAAALHVQGIPISANTVGRLLKARGYSLRTNRKRLARVHEPERDRQFRYIARQRRRFQKQGNPAVSIDTKKKELVGLFKNPGRTWRKEPMDVLDHDFPGLAEGRAIPFGIYNELWRTGFVVIGTSNETAEFAGAALSCWWENQGRWRCPRARRWFIEADGGGANSSRTWAWKWVLQQLADRWEVSITVAHYPPGASKWNPIEHRLFSRISANWQGEPLKDYETIVGFIRDTTSSTGLRCRAALDTTHYPTRVKITKEQKRSIRIKRSKVLPQWNYTIYPHRKRPSYS